MNVLITSPRAPIVLEWIKIASRHKHRVALCDSLHYPVAKFSPFDLVYHKIPSPRLDFGAYANAMMPLIAWADLVIPTCEDIFYLAKLPLTAKDRAKCLMPDTALLFELHHKAFVYRYLPKTDGIQFPNTRLINQHSDVIDDKDSGTKTVLKPVYSRFGRSVVRGTSRQNTQHLTISPAYPWVQQTFITGDGLCNYAICQSGQVIAHAMYRPCYLLNGSASTYFVPVYDRRCDDFVHAFAKHTNYHGQVAFDFIDDGTDLWVLECNPRATSGLHLLGDCLNLSPDGKLYKEGTPAQTPLRVGNTLPLLFGVQALCQGKWHTLLNDHRHSKDVMAKLPKRATILSLGEMVWRSIRHKKPLTCASTFDIEYDGASDDVCL